MITISSVYLYLDLLLLDVVCTFTSIWRAPWRLLFTLYSYGLNSEKKFLYAPESFSIIYRPLEWRNARTLESEPHIIQILLSAQHPKVMKIGVPYSCVFVKTAILAHTATVS